MGSPLMVPELMAANGSLHEISVVIRTAPATPLQKVDSLTVSGRAVVYRLFDVGGEIHLDRALHRLSSSAPERVRPTRVGAQALQIPNPPITTASGPQPPALPAPRGAARPAAI